MNDQLPDFEPEQTSEPAAQPPKKRRKPMRHKAHAVTDAPKRRKMLRKVKATVTRRGRPKGSINKPKVNDIEPVARLETTREFDVVQDVIKKMQLLDRTAAKQLAHLIMGIFAS